MLRLNPELCFIASKNHDDVVGSLIGAFDGRTASIHRLAVAPALQRRGVGTKLVRVFEETLRSKGIDKLTAQIHVSNIAIVPFYEKLGFKEMSYVKTYFKDV